MVSNAQFLRQDQLRAGDLVPNTQYLSQPSPKLYTTLLASANPLPILP